MEARHSAAVARDAPRQPSSTTKNGTSAPASAPPSGTPVCLIEKTSAERCGGVWRARMCELAGVAGPSPRPRATAHAARTGQDPEAVSATAAAETASPAWLMRIAPMRGTSPPLSSEAVIAPA